MARRTLLWKLCLWGLLHAAASSPPAPQAQESALPEYQIKSIWMLNFTRFVEWPAAALGQTNSPFVVGLLGRDPFGRELEQSFAGRPVKAHPLQIKRVNTEQEARACHLLFVPATERRRWRELAEKLTNAPILTVGENDEFLDHGGIINFLHKDNSIQIEVNVSAAQKAGLALNAKLLKIAVKVRGKYE